MQLGKPVIAANNSGIPEVMGKEYPGVYSTLLIHKLVEIIVDSENQNFRNMLTLRYQDKLFELNSAVIAKKLLTVMQD